MALWGSIINALAIMVGGLLGSLVLPRIPEGIRNTVMQGLGIAIAVLGITMALKSENFLIVIISIAVGGILGEVMRIEYRLNQLGHWWSHNSAGRRRPVRRIEAASRKASLRRRSFTA